MMKQYLTTIVTTFGINYLGRTIYPADGLSGLLIQSIIIGTILFMVNK